MAYVGRKGIWSDKTEVESNRPINRLSPVVVIFEKWSIQIYREIAQRVPDAIFLAPTWRCAPVLAEKDSECPCAGQEIRNSPSFCLDSTDVTYPHTLLACIRIYKKRRMGRTKGRDTVAFSTLPMQQWRLRSSDRDRHNTLLTCLYSCREREVGRGEVYTRDRVI